MRMRPTGAVDVVAALVTSGVVVWFVLRFAYSHIPPIPRSAPISLAVVAALAFSTATSLKARLERRPGAKPITALQIARIAPLAKALSTAGALAAGGWLGVLAYVLPTLDREADRHDAITSMIALLPSIALLIGGLWLERLCRAPSPPPDDDVPR